MSPDELRAYKAAYARKYRARNREHLNQYTKELRAKNPDKQKLADSKYYAKHATKIKIQRKNYVRRNPDKVRAANNRWRKANPEKARDAVNRAYHKTNYGWTPEDKLQMLKDQHNRCANPGCRTNDPGKRGWHTDHIKGTKTIRGLLCGTCNRGLGYFHHDTKKLNGAIEYLRRFEHHAGAE